MECDYKKLADSIEKQIAGGIYPAGSIIPSERDLCLLHNTSRTTVRKAIEELALKGLLSKKPGKGTFVSERLSSSSKNTGTVLFLRCRHSPLEYDLSLSGDIFYPHVLAGLEKGAERKGYHCLVKTVDERERNWDCLLPILEKIDGIVCGELHNPDFLEYLQHLRLPLVLISPSVDYLSTDTVVIDNANGTRIATEYLISKGHRNIAFVGGAKESIPSAERKAGFLRAMEKTGIPVMADYLLDTNWLEQDGYRAFEKLYSLNRQPTAVIAASDLLALGIFNSARDKGLAIPSDLSLIGFDGLISTIHHKPVLATMEVRAGAMGETAFQLFHDQMVKARDYSVKIAIPTEFIEGDSTGSVEA